MRWIWLVPLVDLGGLDWALRLVPLLVSESIAEQGRSFAGCWRLVRRGGGQY